MGRKAHGPRARLIPTAAQALDAFNTFEQFGTPIEEYANRRRLHHAPLIRMVKVLRSAEKEKSWTEH